jgi:hypothetical protein
VDLWAEVVVCGKYTQLCYFGRWYNQMVRASSNESPGSPMSWGHAFSIKLNANLIESIQQAVVYGMYAGFTVSIYASRN